MEHTKSKLFDAEQCMNDWTVLTFGQIQCICQQTNLIDKEVCRRHRQFLNISKDGRMNKEQLGIILQDIWPTGNVQKFGNYLFHWCDKNQKGFIEFSELILLNFQLNDDKSYLRFLFDMIDTRHKGYLSQEKIEPLFASLFELIGHPTDEQCGANISQAQIAHLIQVVDKSKHKRLSRDQFIHMRNTNWTDEDNGIGTLLVEHTC